MSKEYYLGNIQGPPGKIPQSELDKIDTAVEIATLAQTAAMSKVDKVSGKQLSAEDYTAAEKSKLAGIATSANNYVHPASHAPGIIAQDINSRFVSDIEKSEWNAKAETTAATSAASGLMSAADKAKLDGIASGAQVNAVASVAGKIGTVALVKGDVGLGNVDNTADTAKPVSVAMQTALNGKVDKVTGKQLSSEDYTSTDKAKLAGITAGAEVNVQPNWSETNTSSGAYIKNKPTSLPASDVAAWAKAATKPTYTASEVGAATAAQGVKADKAEPAFTKNAAFNKSFGSASGTVCEGNDSRLSNARTPVSHSHGNDDLTGISAWAKSSGKPTYTASEIGAEPAFAKNAAFNKAFGTAAGTVCQGNDSRLSNARSASDVSAWAKAAVKPSYTASEVGAEPAFTKNSAFNKAFGTASGTVCEGNDARLSNSRPASDVSTWAKASSKPAYTASEVGAAATTHSHTISQVTNLSSTINGLIDKVALWQGTASDSVTISLPNTLKNDDSNGVATLFVTLSYPYNNYRYLYTIPVGIVFSDGQETHIGYTNASSRGYNANSYSIPTGHSLNVTHNVAGTITFSSYAYNIIDIKALINKGGKI